MFCIRNIAMRGNIYGNVAKDWGWISKLNSCSNSATDIRASANTYTIWGTGMIAPQIFIIVVILAHNQKLKIYIIVVFRITEIFIV